MDGFNILHFYHSLAEILTQIYPVAHLWLEPLNLSIPRVQQALENLDAGPEEYLNQVNHFFQDLLTHFASNCAIANKEKQNFIQTLYWHYGIEVANHAKQAIKDEALEAFSDLRGNMGGSTNIFYDYILRLLLPDGT